MFQKIVKWSQSSSNNAFSWTVLYSLVRTFAVIVPTIVAVGIVISAKMLGIDFVASNLVGNWIIFLSLLVAFGAKFILVFCPASLRTVKRYSSFVDDQKNLVINEHGIELLYQSIGKKLILAKKDEKDAMLDYYYSLEFSVQPVRIVSGILVYVGMMSFFVIDLIYMFAITSQFLSFR